MYFYSNKTFIFVQFPLYFFLISSLISITFLEVNPMFIVASKAAPSSNLLHTSMRVIFEDEDLMSLLEK
ncbi:ORF342 [White spot syndrome virus]|uniref:ORF342 n=1 Tax=White spot syndrome virus TaxID=342409 RepID=A0A2D3I6M1_9VIRU|nr:ORF342 [White spot syndrome virus]